MENGLSDCLKNKAKFNYLPHSHTTPRHRYPGRQERALAPALALALAPHSAPASGLQVAAAAAEVVEVVEVEVGAVDRISIGLLKII